jgi:hypothetical protein
MLPVQRKRDTKAPERVESSNRKDEAALQFRRAWVSRACVEEVCRSVGTRRNVDESLLHKHTPAAALLNGTIVAPDDGRNHEMRVHPKQHPGESLCGVSNRRPAGRPTGKEVFTLKYLMRLN